MKRARFQRLGQPVMPPGSLTGYTRPWDRVTHCRHAISHLSIARRACESAAKHVQARRKHPSDNEVTMSPQMRGNNSSKTDMPSMCPWMPPHNISYSVYWSPCCASYEFNVNILSFSICICLIHANYMPIVYSLVCSRLNQQTAAFAFAYRRMITVSPLGRTFRYIAGEHTVHIDELCLLYTGE